MNLQTFKRIGIAAMTVIALAANGQITPENLRVEQLNENILINTPSGTDDNPRFSWINTPAPGAMGEAQKAYQICVATSQEALLQGKVDIWDSKKVKSSSSYLVDYKGGKLAEATDYFWRVRVWNAKGKASA